ncbi:hypothetical protein [Streptobacillus moniliformis]|uniref:hypothetical protein n=1 Tax=Streptobacillus moniliformis TaxID=34105 RepID=UPI0007E3C47E|nr:hypothetical protein [Streptobacillus moniliformis]
MANGRRIETEVVTRYDNKGLKEFNEELNKLSTSQDNLNKKGVEYFEALVTALQELGNGKKDIKETVTELEKLSIAMEMFEKLAVASANSIGKLSKSIPLLTQNEKDLMKSLSGSMNKITSLNMFYQQLHNTLSVHKSDLTITKTKLNALNSSIKENKQIIKGQKEELKQVKQEYRQISSTTTALAREKDKLNERVEKLSLNLKKIAKSNIDLMSAKKGLMGTIKELTSRVRKLETQMKIVTRELDLTAKSIKKVSDNSSLATKTLEKFAKAGTLAFSLNTARHLMNFVNRMKNVVLSTVDASSKMIELQNITEQVFESSSQAIESWAKKTGDSMGRSTYHMQEYASNIGSVYKGIGIEGEMLNKVSQDLAKFSVDLASFKNISDDEAFRAVMAGIVGESEPLKRRGILVNELVMQEYILSKGIKERWVNLSQAEKVMHRYNKIMESATFIHGDAERTIGTYANQVKVLEANFNELSITIGDKLKGAFTVGLVTLNGFLKGLNKWLSFKGANDYLRSFAEQKQQLTSLASRYKDLSQKSSRGESSNEEEKERLAIYEQLITMYPELQNLISKEAKEWEKVNGAVQTVINSIKEKIKLQQQEEFYSSLKDIAGDKQKQIIELQKQYEIQKIQSSAKLGISEDLLNKLVNDKNVESQIYGIAHRLQHGNKEKAEKELESYLNYSDLFKGLNSQELKKLADNWTDLKDEYKKLKIIADSIQTAEEEVFSKLSTEAKKHSDEIQSFERLMGNIVTDTKGNIIGVIGNSSKENVEKIKQATDVAKQNLTDTEGNIIEEVLNAKLVLLEAIKGYSTVFKGNNGHNYTVSKTENGKYRVKGTDKRDVTFSSLEQAKIFIEYLSKGVKAPSSLTQKEDSKKGFKNGDRPYRPNGTVKLNKWQQLAKNLQDEINGINDKDLNTTTFTNIINLISGVGKNLGLLARKSKSFKSLLDSGIINDKEKIELEIQEHESVIKTLLDLAKSTSDKGKLSKINNDIKTYKDRLTELKDKLAFANLFNSLDEEYKKITTAIDEENEKKLRDRLEKNILASKKELEKQNFENASDKKEKEIAIYQNAITTAEQNKAYKLRDYYKEVVKQETIIKDLLKIEEDIASQTEINIKLKQLGYYKNKDIIDKQIADTKKQIEELAKHNKLGQNDTKISELVSVLNELTSFLNYNELTALEDKVKIGAIKQSELLKKYADFLENDSNYWLSVGDETRAINLKESAYQNRIYSLEEEKKELNDRLVNGLISEIDYKKEETNIQSKLTELHKKSNNLLNEKISKLQEMVLSFENDDKLNSYNFDKNLFKNSLKTIATSNNSLLLEDSKYQALQQAFNNELEQFSEKLFKYKKEQLKDFEDILDTIDVKDNAEIIKEKFSKAKARLEKNTDKYGVEISKNIIEVLEGLERQAIELNNKTKKLSKPTTNEIFKNVNDYFNHLKQAIQMIASTLPQEEQEIVSVLLDVFGNIFDMATNIAKAVLTLNPQDIINSIMSVVKFVTDIASKILKGLDDTEFKKSKIEYDNRKLELRDIAINLYELNRNMRELNLNLVKVASENTSNANIDRNQKMLSEFTKAFATNFNPKLLINGVEERRLRFSRDGREEKFKKGVMNYGALSIPISGGLLYGALGLYKLIEVATRKNKSANYTENFSDLYQVKGKTSKELREDYKKISALSEKDLEKFSKTEKDSSKNFEWKLRVSASNLEEIKKQFLEHIQNVEKAEKRVTDFKKEAILESFDGVSIISKEEQIKQYVEHFKKLHEGRKDLDKILPEVEKQARELITQNEAIVTAFEDTRKKLTDNIALGKQGLETLAESLQSYFNKLRTNMSKVFYDSQFRDFEEKANKKFLDISQKLRDLRLSGKSVKELKQDLSFEDFFKDIKAFDSLNNDVRDLVQFIREQAKKQGIDDSLIDKMLPLNEMNEKSKELGQALSKAMKTALDTNSFNQFSMSLGDSIYNSVKESLIKAFAESDTYKKIIEKYLNTEEYKQQLSKAQTPQQAFDVIKEQLDKAEQLLRANGLSFRDTNGASGEYLGGGISTAKTIPTQQYQGNVELTFNFYNNGVADSETLKEFAKKVKDILFNEKKTEVLLSGK